MTTNNNQDNVEVVNTRMDSFASMSHVDEDVVQTARDIYNRSQGIEEEDSSNIDGLLEALLDEDEDTEAETLLEAILDGDDSEVDEIVNSILEGEDVVAELEETEVDMDEIDKLIESVTDDDDDLGITEDDLENIAEDMLDDDGDEATEEELDEIFESLWDEIDDETIEEDETEELEEDDYDSILGEIVNDDLLEDELEENEEDYDAILEAILDEEEEGSTELSDLLEDELEENEDDTDEIVFEDDDDDLNDLLEDLVAEQNEAIEEEFIEEEDADAILLEIMSDDGVSVTPDPVSTGSNRRRADQIGTRQTKLDGGSGSGSSIFDLDKVPRAGRRRADAFNSPNAPVNMSEDEKVRLAEIFYTQIEKRSDSIREEYDKKIETIREGAKDLVAGKNAEIAQLVAENKELKKIKAISEAARDLTLTQLAHVQNVMEDVEYSDTFNDQLKEVCRTNFNVEVSELDVAPLDLLEEESRFQGGVDKYVSYVNEMSRGAF